MERRAALISALQADADTALRIQLTGLFSEH
jgi:hypothetical protein